MNDKDLVLSGPSPHQPGPDETVGANEPEDKEIILPPDLRAIPPADIPADEPLAESEPESNAQHDRTDPAFEGPYVELDETLCDDPYLLKAAKVHLVYGDHKHIEILFNGTTGIVNHAVATSHVAVMAPKADGEGEVERPFPAKFKLDLSGVEGELNLLADWPGVTRKLRDLIKEQDGPEKEKAHKQALDLLEAHTANQAKEVQDASNVKIFTSAELRLIERKSNKQKAEQERNRKHNAMQNRRRGTKSH